MTPLIYGLFFLSGFSGLVYQVVWVRVFGNAFGNTIYSASLVIAVFMLGLGAGSYLMGRWADRRYADLNLDRPAAAPTSQSLLRGYGYLELAIGLIGLGISALLLNLDHVSALISSYTRDANGWYVLSTTSHLARIGIAVILLTPITLLMGGTLTLLIRHLVRDDVERGGWRIAVLYGVNTAGAALGCVLTDFVLVPSWGLLGTQAVAALLNIVAGIGALCLAAWTRSPAQAAVRLKADRPHRPRPSPGAPADDRAAAVALTSLALALSGFAAMGMEIVWFRHFRILLGEFRAVFSLLLAVILLGIGVGSLAGGFLHRRTARPAQWLIAAQGLFIASSLLGLAAADARDITAAVITHPAYRADLGRAVMEAGWARTFEEIWFNAGPIVLEVGVPALLMGFAFPLANAIIQRTERLVGQRAGVLYLANTVGAVCGSLAAGFLLLPTLGIQHSATLLMVTAALAVVPLHLAASRTTPAVAFSVAVAGVALGMWLLLPSNHVIGRAIVLTDKDRLLTLSEGINEVIAVTDVPGQGRLLLTNGHPMSSTDALSQRYMRALAHLPLLSIDNPETVLVICFGVGNTAHAATLHPSVRRVEVVDLSRNVLSHARFFAETNGDVLADPRVAVYVNDGRHHLQMPGVSYDVITLEPPPIVHAGMGALYSKEFYARARARLKPKGYISQWLPVAGVPEETTLALIRAFIEVFPQAVLVSGAHTNLLLVGTTDSRIELDPARVGAALSDAPAVRADLERIDLGTLREIVGTFVGSARTLAEATRDVDPASDDRPVQEYGVRSQLNFGSPPPASMVDVSQVAAWCPKCFEGGKPAPFVDGLDTYLALLNLVYSAPAVATTAAPARSEGRARVIAGSAYLGAVIPESADLHKLLGLALAANGDVDGAVAEFREAWRLTPNDAQAGYRLATILLESGRYGEAVDQFRAVLRLMPDSAEARNNLGVSLASQGGLEEAIEQFREALKRQPDFEDARRNLAAALQQQAQKSKD